MEVKKRNDGITCQWGIYWAKTSLSKLLMKLKKKKKKRGNKLENREVRNKKESILFVKSEGFML